MPNLSHLSNQGAMDFLTSRFRKVMSERGQLMKKKQEQAGADLCQAQFKLGLARPAIAYPVSYASHLQAR